MPRDYVLPPPQNLWVPSDSGGCLHRKPLIAFDLLSGSETGCRAGGLLSGTSNPSRPPPCRAGSHLARPACQFPPGANSSRTGAGAVAGSGGVMWRRCGRSVFQISLSACGACDVEKINREKSDRAAVAHGNTERFWTAPWICLDMKCWCGLLRWGGSVFGPPSNPGVLTGRTIVCRIFL